MTPGTSRRRAKQRRCRQCGRFTGRSDVKLCPGCLAKASSNQKPEPDVSDAELSASPTTEFGRTLADLGLDVRFLSQNQSQSVLTKPSPDRTAGLPHHSTPLLPPTTSLQPPLQNMQDSLLRRARHDSVIARTTELRPRPILSGAGTPKSVSTTIGPVAAARRARGQSCCRGTRQHRAKPRATARPLAMAVVLILIGAAVGAAIPVLLFMLAP